MKVILHLRVILILIVHALCCISFAQERDSIYVYQDINDSFTKHGIPEVFITLADTNGVLIDTLWTKSRYNSNSS